MLGGVLGGVLGVRVVLERSTSVIHDSIWLHSGMKRTDLTCCRQPCSHSVHRRHTPTHRHRALGGGGNQNTALLYIRRTATNHNNSTTINLMESNDHAGDYHPHRHHQRILPPSTPKSHPTRCQRSSHGLGDAPPPPSTLPSSARVNQLETD